MNARWTAWIRFRSLSVCTVFGSYAPSSRPKNATPDPTAKRSHTALTALLTGTTKSNPTASNDRHVNPLPRIPIVIDASSFSLGFHSTTHASRIFGPSLGRLGSRRPSLARRRSGFSSVSLAGSGQSACRRCAPTRSAERRSAFAPTQRTSSGNQLLRASNFLPEKLKFRGSARKARNLLTRSLWVF